MFICYGLIFFIFGYIIHRFYNKNSIYVTKTLVVANLGFGSTISLPISQLTAVSTDLKLGISLTEASGRVTIIPRIENRNKVIEVITNLMANNKKTDTIVNQPLSNADELKKFKELLDSGVITQKEFEDKKKELLASK